MQFQFGSSSHIFHHCWGDESVKAIGNAVGKYIDRFEPRENMHACARICVEVDLGKGLGKLSRSRWINGCIYNSWTMSNYPSNARYVTNMDILQIDVEN